MTTPKPRTHFLLAALLAATTFATGCFVTPKTSALHRVHEAYRNDFSELVLPAPGDAPAPAAPGSSPAFARTLQFMHEYRRQYPGDSAELAHLTVLEGMIYLQAGRLGLAEALSEGVKTAGAKLASASGRIVRDQLFARNYPALVEGWREIREKNDGNNTTIAEWRKLLSAAQQIETNLAAITEKQLADPDADQGAIYLANTAAIFYVWAFALRAEESPAEANAVKSQWFGSARDLISRFLTPTEKLPAAAIEVSDRALGRVRYIQWYDWLRQRAAS